MVTAIPGLLSNTFLFVFGFAIYREISSNVYKYIQINFYVIAIIATQELFTHTQSLEETCSSNSKLDYYETSFWSRKGENLRCRYSRYILFKVILSTLMQV